MKELFVELLQVALGTRKSLSRVPSATEWQSLFDEVDRQGVKGLAFTGIDTLQNSTPDCLPDKDILRQWLADTLAGEGDYEIHCQRVCELTKRFREAGFKSCVLKGLSSARRYPEPSRRQCGDIDLWVQGKREEITAFLHGQCEVKHMEWHHAGAKFFEDLPVEVHFHPSWLYNPWRNRRLQRWFKSQEEVVFKDNSFQEGFVATPASFDAVYQLTHCFHHIMEEGLGIRHMVDYYYVLKNLDCQEQAEAMRVIRAIGLDRFAGAVMWIMSSSFGLLREELICEPLKREGGWLLNEIMTAGNFGKTRTDGLRRNTFARWWMMLRHYPGEALWMWPWKVWHWGWRKMNNHIVYG